jgi:apolipoprotein N-acyltransferase
LLNFALAIATGVLLILTFPDANFSFLAAVALTPLLVALAREARPLRRALLGYVAGIVYWAGACYWIQFVLEVHGGMGFWGSRGSFLLFCLFKREPTGIWASPGRLSATLASA